MVPCRQWCPSNHKNSLLRLDRGYPKNQGRLIRNRLTHKLDNNGVSRNIPALEALNDPY